MSDSKSCAQGVVFDFGTSPHGLSVDLRHADQETRGAGGLHSLVDGFDLAAAAAEGDAPSGAAPRAEAGQSFTFTEEQRRNLAYATLCHITTLEDSDESEEPAVQEAIRFLIEARDILMDERWQL